MILKRREKEPLLNKLANYLWPAMGWGRFVTYVKKRVMRLADSPHSVTLGISLGFAACFNPYVGTHIIQAVILATIFRANIAASALGTLLGNPSTFPFIWWAAIAVGQTLLELFGFHAAPEISQTSDIKSLLVAAKNDPVHILAPWTVGAYVIGTASIPVTYALFYPLVKASKAARTQLIKARRARKENENE